jgi:hypothetical protein
MPFATNQRDAVSEIAPRTIDNPYHHDYIKSRVASVYVDDIGELYDRQNTVYFITMTACIVAIISAVIVSSNK